MNKVNLLFYMLMTALSLTSYVTSAQVVSNTQRLKEILPQSSWSYLFPRSVITYQQFIDLAAKRPQFCGTDHEASQGADLSCRKQLANAFAQLSTMTALNDVSLEIEPWRQGLMVADKRLCQLKGRSIDSVCVGLMPQLVDRVLVDANAKLSDEGGLKRSSHSMPPVGYSPFRHYDLFAGFLQVP